MSEPRKPWVAPRGGGYSAPNAQNQSGDPVPPKGPGAVSPSVPTTPAEEIGERVKRLKLLHEILDDIQDVKRDIADMLAQAWEQGHTAGLNDAQLGEDDDGYADNPYEGTPHDD